MSGILLYEGASLIDGGPIAAIVTNIYRKSKNLKTGNMCQLYIVRSDVNPIGASVEGLDKSVCGSCKHRHSLGGGCYVNLAKGLYNIYWAYKRGSYMPYNPRYDDILRGRIIRLGAYGEPSAIPKSVCNKLVTLSSRHTGYIHNWQSAHISWRDIVMASVETRQEYDKAKSKGYKTFRVRVDDKLYPGEIDCINSQTDGKVQCADCNMCAGKSSKDISVLAHGRLKSRLNLG